MILPRSINFEQIWNQLNPHIWSETKPEALIHETADVAQRESLRHINSDDGGVAHRAIRLACTLPTLGVIVQCDMKGSLTLSHGPQNNLISAGPKYRINWRNRGRGLIFKETYTDGVSAAYRISCSFQVSMKFVDLLFFDELLEKVRFSRFRNGEIMLVIV